MGFIVFLKKNFGDLVHLKLIPSGDFFCFKNPFLDYFLGPNCHIFKSSIFGPILHFKNKKNTFFSLNLFYLKNGVATLYVVFTNLYMSVEQII